MPAMTASLRGDASYGLYLGAPASAAAAPHAMVASHLGIDADSLHRHIDSPGSPILQGLSGTEATRLYHLLLATGWPASIQPERARPTTDLSLQPAIWADCPRLARRLAPILDQDRDTVQADLHRPGGLVLSAGDPRRARLTDHALRPLRGLTVIASDPQTALHDLYPIRSLPPRRRADIAQRLLPFGTPACSTTGALAEGLTTALRDLAMVRLDPEEVIAVNRAFQRFELHLIGVTGWVWSELADFLALRTGQPRARFEVISPADPIILDTALTHGVARQFCADYAAIGLFTRLHLRGLPRNIDNPIR